MSSQPKRFALLLMVFSFLGLTLVACQTGGVGGSGSSGDSGVSGFKTPNPLLWTPTPTFPPFTVGAWPSNYSPQNNDTVTIYVLCRKQPSDMNGPGTPVDQVSVHIQISQPELTKTADGKTDSQGLAAIPITFSDPYSGVPVRVYVSASWGGKTYNAETDFTPAVTTVPTPTPGDTGTPGTTPTP